MRQLVGLIWAFWVDVADDIQWLNRGFGNIVGTDFDNIEEMISQQC